MYTGPLKIESNNEKRLYEEGYQKILPNEQMLSEKMSLSLWRQGTCLSQAATGETEVTTKVLIMRPIFSSAKDKGVRSYHIAEYLNGKGKISTESKPVTPAPPSSSSKP